MTRPRKAGVSDYDDLIAFLNKIFGIRMDMQYGHIYKPTRKDMSNNIIIRDEGRIVSCVGIFPITLLCGDARLSVGGVGGVSTEPKYRGRGLMSKLLDKSVSIMRRRDNDISILWGDRRR
ncbi:GNAT family N-acetyltransferase, partial [bacterium]|nr:GNAT family N-acetyltransferase [bacterium]